MARLTVLTFTIACGDADTESSNGPSPDVEYDVDAGDVGPQTGDASDVATVADGQDDVPGPHDAEDGSDAPVPEDAPDVNDATDAGDTAEVMPPDDIDDEPAAGDHCSVAFQFTAQGVFVGDTSAATDHYSSASCDSAPSVGDGAPDQVWVLTAESPALFAVSVEADFDARLYGLSSCDSEGESCLSPNSDGSFGIQLAAGESVFIVIDGATANEEGAYSLTAASLPIELTCDFYCGLVSGVCAGQNAQYASPSACFDFCGDSLSPGSLSDTVNNTLGCRIGQALAAAQDPAHCAAAGPDGGDQCGSLCANYCALSAALCPAAGDGPDDTSADELACADGCAALNADGPPGVMVGNSVQCRIAHLVEVANGAEGALHCGDSELDGGINCSLDGPTGDSCDDPITVSNLPWSGIANTALLTDQWAGCNTVNDAPDAVFSFTPDTSGSYDITLSPGDGLTHPSLVSLTTDCGACLAQSGDLWSGGLVTFELLANTSYHIIVDAIFPGDVGAFELTVEGTPPMNCSSYCALIDSACIGSNTQFFGEEACLSWCEAGATFEADEAIGSNTLICRAGAAEQAAESGLAAFSFCAAAGPSGGNVCGTWCENYCAAAMAHCDPDFPNTGACVSACSDLNDGGSPGDVTYDTVQCRLHHLSLAASDTDNGSLETACAAAEIDSGDVCAGVLPPDGDSCAALIPLGSIPFAASGNTANLADNFFGAIGCVPPEGANDGVPDQAYRFEPAVSGPYTFTLTPGSDLTNPSLIMVTTSCDEAAATCVGMSGDLFDGGDVVFDLDASATYTVIVDGIFSGDVGDYLLDVSGP
ncbi:MAG: hypothetical protein ACI9OJ_001674 [Myxococcota bacterium]|jgi:hypothetical protein